VESGRQLLSYLDTHTALWLANGSTQELSATALEIIEMSELRISPVVLFEASLLHEIGRIRIGPQEIRTILWRDFETFVCSVPFEEVAEAAWSETWTRDPFDRLIVAQAKAAGGKLITKDRRIHANFNGAIW
jgi:PIN domain nuclease of toxin-antitoxin system